MGWGATRAGSPHPPDGRAPGSLAATLVTVAYVIVSILLGFTVLMGLAMALAVWGGVKVARPELLEKSRDRGGDDGPPDSTTGAGAVSTRL